MIKRGISGSLLVAVLVWALMEGTGIYFPCLWLLISAVAFFEGGKLAGVEHVALQRVYGLSAFVWWLCEAGYLYSQNHSVLMAAPFLVGLIFFFGCSSQFMLDQAKELRVQCSSLCFSLFYVGIFFTAPALLYSKTGGLMILFVFCVMWLQDTFAYFCGMMIGKHAFAPQLSPKKTWEGSVCGFLIAGVVLFLGRDYFTLPDFLDIPSIWNFTLVFVLAAVAGQTGDLLESMIKRFTGTKDSGNIIPGHGGVLDRFDSMVAGSAVLSVLLLLCGG
jgi:phosphatidate cytidylyltransferase